MELKPCPFCGELPYIIEHVTIRGGHARWYSLKCWECEYERTGFETIEEAIEAWNRRNK